MRDKYLSSEESLGQMLEAIEKIELFCTATDEKKFCKDLKLNSAVLLHFIIIGEAITNVDNELLKKYDYPWHKVKSFRNLIAHQYHKITMKMVWAIIIKDLSPLKARIKQILVAEYKHRTL